MKLEEIIETVKHDVEYFNEPETDFQAGRAWEAGKILDMLYKLNQPNSINTVLCGEGVKETQLATTDDKKLLKHTDEQLTQSPPNELLPAAVQAQIVRVAFCNHEYTFDDNGRQYCKWCNKGI